MKRKIAALLAADLVGYSRLMAEDEEETMRRLMSYRAVFDDFITRAEGRIFNTAGDAVLAEFPSAVDAVRAAIDIQESLRTRNMSYPPSRHMVFRIGLTIGDVIEREGDLLGDGVNVAARLQGLATPGGICVSRSVHEQVADKLSVIFSDLGPQDVKNLPRPVHAYLVQLEQAPSEHASVANAKAQADAVNRLSTTLLAIIVALAIALGAMGSFVIINKPWSRQETTLKKEVATAVPAPVAASSEVRANPSAAAKLSAPSSSSEASPTVPVRSFADRLTAILEKGAPKESSQSRKDSVSAFSTLASHRAMAIAPRAKGHWRTGGWPSRPVMPTLLARKRLRFMPRGFSR
nr:adenylate/guanylate cyclase domain-containing protein [Bradyrhizobium sp. JYMT SZCCT0428]